LKCGYNHCLFDGEVDKEMAIKIGSRYYHKDCAKQKQDKEEIRKIYLEEVNSTEVVKVLNAVINNIIHIKKVDSGLLLYALKYAIQNKFTFHSPAGLYYIINNKNIKDNYYKQEPIRKLYGNNVLLSDEEYNRLLDEMSERKLLNYIDRLDNYISSTNKQYTSHYHTMLTWFNKDTENKPVVNNNITIHSS
jgi:hypothetical protein